MSKLSYSDLPFIFQCLALVATSICLAWQPHILGMVLIVWSSITLMRFIKILGITFESKPGSETRKAVGNLLNGLTKSKERKNDHTLTAGLKTSLVMLLVLSFLSALLLFVEQGISSLETISYLALAGLIFWHVQDEAVNPVKASIIGTILATLFSIQLAGFYTITINPNEILAGSTNSLLLLSGLLFLAAIFIRGLFIRHRHHFFPAIGLFLVMFLSVTFSEISLSAVPVIAGLLAICFAQSFPSARPEYHRYIHRSQVYT